MPLEPPQAVIDELLSGGWIQAVHWYPEIDSTSNAARRALDERSTQLPALFVADQQTAGRGRNERVWWSPAGCLMLTIAVDGECLPDNPDEWSQLALICGKTVADVAGRFVEDRAVQLKWPNDVYVSGKKVAGILIESATAVGSAASGVLRPNWLIGIGINIDLRQADMPLALTTKATCLSVSAGRAIDRMVVLVELIDQLHRQLTGWCSGQLHWQDAWRERCLLSGKEICVQIDPRRQLSGICDGVDVAGRLMLRTATDVHLLSTGEVLAWQ
jgi:BirA family biotin operon repressor/biotin-[acetyl-CoA-carboxylase] ligase